jgi:DNA repair protein RadD
MTELRAYQIKSIEDFNREIAAGRRRIMLVMPTGGGKTVVACSIIKQFVDAYKSVVAVSHRREIVTQTADKLRDQRITYGIIQAGIPPGPLARVQVASIQTLHRRAIHAEKMDLPPADLLWIDESHHTPARTYKQIIDAYPDAILLGTTATPCRGDGRGLGSIFEVITEAPQVADLITQGYLVSTKVYAPIDPNLRGVRTVAGDFHEGQLGDRIDRPQLIGDIISHWHKYSERRRTVCFAVSVGHSIHIRMNSSSPESVPSTLTAGRRNRNAMHPLPDWRVVKSS